MSSFHKTPPENSNSEIVASRGFSCSLPVPDSQFGSGSCFPLPTQFLRQVIHLSGVERRCNDLGAIGSVDGELNDEFVTDRITKVSCGLSSAAPARRVFEESSRPNSEPEKSDNLNLLLFLSDMTCVKKSLGHATNREKARIGVVSTSLLRVHINSEIDP
jgi:hypothetical protein